MTTPVAVALLTRCRTAGVSLIPRGDNLRWRARQGPPDDLLAALVRHKPEVLAALRTSIATAKQIPEIPENRVSGISGMRNSTVPDSVRGRNPLLCPVCGDELWLVDRSLVACATCNPELPASQLGPGSAGPHSVTYHQRVSRAESWDELYAILTDAEIAYAAGELTAEGVDLICDLCRVAHRQLPEHVIGEGR